VLAFRGRSLRGEAVVVMGRVRLEVRVVDGLALALTMGLGLGLGWKPLLGALEAFLLSLGLQEKVNLVFGVGDSPSFPRDGWESDADLGVGGLGRLLFLVDDLVGKDEGVMDISEQLLVGVRPASSYLLKGRVVGAGTGVLEGKLLPTGVVEGRLVGRENKLVVFLSRFRFVLGAKSESKVSIGIRQLRGRSSGTARARKLWAARRERTRRPEEASVALCAAPFEVKVDGFCKGFLLPERATEVESFCLRGYSTFIDLYQDLRSIL